MHPGAGSRSGFAVRRQNVENFRGFSVVFTQVPVFPLSFTKMCISPDFGRVLTFPCLSTKCANFRILAGGCTLEFCEFRTHAGNLRVSQRATPIFREFRRISPDFSGFRRFMLKPIGLISFSVRTPPPPTWVAARSPLIPRAIHGVAPPRARSHPRAHARS